MIRQISAKDIRQVVELHKNELSGFLSELGIPFLKKFYKVSFDIPEMFTYVEENNGHILGFTSGISRTKGLYKKIIFKNIFYLIVPLLSYFIVHPLKVIKMLKILSYPAFSEDIPELLTLVVKKEEQNRGIGRKLFQAVSEEFEKRRIKEFYVSAYERLLANGFYRKIGCRLDRSFNFLGEKMNYYKCRIIK